MSAAARLFMFFNSSSKSGFAKACFTSASSLKSSLVVTLKAVSSEGQRAGVVPDPEGLLSSNGLKYEGTSAGKAERRVKEMKWVEETYIRRECSRAWNPGSPLSKMKEHHL